MDICFNQLEEEREKEQRLDQHLVSHSLGREQKERNRTKGTNVAIVMKTRSDLQSRQSGPDVELEHSARLLEVGRVVRELVDDNWRRRDATNERGATEEKQRSAHSFLLALAA